MNSYYMKKYYFLLDNILSSFTYSQTDSLSLLICYLAGLYCAYYSLCYRNKNVLLRLYCIAFDVRI